jgi:hypothetical protein
LARLADNENGIYGLFKGIREVMRCKENGSHYELWVAGADSDPVELVRNSILSDIQ